MKTLEKIKEYSWAITLVLDRMEKQSKIQSAYIDSICTKKEVQRIVEIEGLKAEKRMIQSTDRKIMDVNRQSQIDLEIKKLENSK